MQRIVSWTLKGRTFPRGFKGCFITVNTDDPFQTSWIRSQIFSLIRTDLVEKRLSQSELSVGLGGIKKTGTLSSCSAAKIIKKDCHKTVNNLQTWRVSKRFSLDACRVFPMADSNHAVLIYVSVTSWRGTTVDPALWWFEWVAVIVRHCVSVFQAVSRRF